MYKKLSISILDHIVNFFINSFLSFPFLYYFYFCCNSEQDHTNEDFIIFFLKAYQIKSIPATCGDSRRRNKTLYYGKKKRLRSHSERILRDRETTHRRGFTRIATNCLKINIIRFVRIRAGDIGVGIIDSPTISHEEVLGPWCITQNRTVKKECNEEKIDRPADLADPSPRICKAVARHAVDPRFIGISVFVSLSLSFSLYLLENSSLLSRDISLLRGRAASRCTPGGDFCAAENRYFSPG